MEDGQKSLFDPEVPHFFKIILDDTIQSGELVIPKKFMRKYGAELSKSGTVLLKVPGGDLWQVQLRRGDDSVWLEKGWLDFVKFYSIKYGHLVVFRYKLEVSNELNVIVLDRSATEIEYPLKSHVTSSPFKEEHIDEDEVVQTETKTSGADPFTRITRSRMGPLRGEEKAEALERANSFKSSNPYFLVVMQPYHIHPSYRLNVPGRFLQTYLGKKKSGEMKLHVSSDKIWTVGYNINVQGRRVKAKVSRGWKAFVVDNGLVFGDVCVFELIKTLRSTLFRISIFRAPQAAKSPSTSQLQASGGGAALFMLEDCSGAKSKHKEKNAFSDMKQYNIDQKIARGFKPQPACLFVSKHPFFQVVVTKACVLGILTIPAGFAREHLNEGRREQIATLEVGDQSWLTKVIVQKSSKVVFSAGFLAFVKGNSLKVGDLCTFELIRREQILFRISIRGVDEEGRD